LEKHAPAESKALLRFEKRSFGKIGVGKDGRAAFGETQPQDIGSAALLLQTPLLGLVDREQRIVDGGITLARPIAFDKRNKLPNDFLKGLNGGEIAGQAKPKTRAEAQLGFIRDVRIIQIVVAIGIEHTVGKDRRREPRRLA